jgi:predicted nucleic acid-binding protein
VGRDRLGFSRPRPTSIPFRSIPTPARAFGRVAASVRRAGRKTSARAYDAMIAAVAMANDLPVYTCNPDDFSGIDGLDVVAVLVPRSSVGS